MSKSSNFLPVFDVNERKRFAQIAINASLDDHYYESLHGSQVQSQNELTLPNDNPDVMEMDEVVPRGNQY